MVSDDVAVASGPVDRSTMQPTRTAPALRRPIWGFRLLLLLLLAGLGVGGFYVVTSAKERSQEPEHRTAAVRHGEEGSSGALPRAQVVKPKRGGMPLTTKQPGTIHAFEFARLYAKVAGYIEKLNVDRGSRVKEGDLLAELYVPELVAAVEQAKAGLARADAAVVQAQAHVRSAQQTIIAKQADQKKAVADLNAMTAEREYREKAYKRMTDLVGLKAVEQRLLDEELDRYHSALAKELAAQSEVAAAAAHVAEAEAQLAQAHADLVGARADVKVSQANLDKEKSLEQYTHIKSPYTGVIIFRGESVHKGAFIPSAEQRMDDPMLTVARDDVMRTIVPVPDDFVPYCNVGDPAIVRLDALHGREFKGVVSRMAESEDVSDRTMRVEIDLNNPVEDERTQSRVLRDGMFGRAEIILEESTPNLTVPSTCVIDRDSEGRGSVQVVRDGKLYRKGVTIGRDNGLLAEILTGLDPDDQVVLQPLAGMADGTPVEVETPSAGADSNEAETKHE